MKAATLIDTVWVLSSLAVVLALDTVHHYDAEKPRLVLETRMIVGICLAGLGLYISASSGIGGGCIPPYTCPCVMTIHGRMLRQTRHSSWLNPWLRQVAFWSPSTSL